MSVLQCDRRDCENILCTRLILNHSAYICNECWEELLSYRAKWPLRMTVIDVRAAIERFMNEPPGVLDEAGIEEEFKRLTAFSTK